MGRLFVVIGLVVAMIGNRWLHDSTHPLGGICTFQPADHDYDHNHNHMRQWAAGAPRHDT